MLGFDFLPLLEQCGVAFQAERQRERTARRLRRRKKKTEFKEGKRKRRKKAPKKREEKKGGKKEEEKIRSSGIHTQKMCFGRGLCVSLWRRLWWRRVLPQRLRTRSQLARCRLCLGFVLGKIEISTDFWEFKGDSERRLSRVKRWSRIAKSARPVCELCINSQSFSKKVT